MKKKDFWPKKCPTCNQWQIIDSLGGIHATGLGDGLKTALESITVTRKDTFTG